MVLYTVPLPEKTNSALVTRAATPSPRHQSCNTPSPRDQSFITQTSGRREATLDPARMVTVQPRDNGSCASHEPERYFHQLWLTSEVEGCCRVCVIEDSG